jgi:hypothetical protein
MSLIIGFLCALLCVSVSNAQNAGTTRYFALLIGNENYKHWVNLKTPHNDVRALAQVLKRYYGYHPAWVRVLTDATRTEMVEALEDLQAKLTEKDNLLVYYAGHGALKNEGGFWVGVDGKKNRRSNWLHYKTISDLLDVRNGMKANHVLVIADSCFAGAVLRGGDEEVDRDEANRVAWLRKMSRLRSRKAFTSGGTEPVIDSVGTSQNSVFASDLVDYLRRNQDVLEAQALFDRIKTEVHARAIRAVGETRAQVPNFGTLHGIGDQGGEFLFVPNGKSISTVSIEPGLDDVLTRENAGPVDDAIELRIDREPQIVYSSTGPFHLGDEKFTSKKWANLTGRCHSLDFTLPENPQDVDLYLEVYGAENTIVYVNDRPFHSAITQRNKPGRTRPNYWSRALKIGLPNETIAAGVNSIRVCGDDVPRPEHPGDLDDFQIRNIKVVSN